MILCLKQGISMLASVLNSDRAFEVNITILRTFVKLRQLLLHHKDLADKIEKLERKYDEQFQVVFAALQQMLKEDTEPRKRIGFRQSGEKYNTPAYNTDGSVNKLVTVFAVTSPMPAVKNRS